ncbi:MAG: glycosyltransferase family 39 protein [Bacteroidota bacterium]
MHRSLPYLILFALVAGLLVLSAFRSPVWYDDAGHYLVVRELVAEGTPCYPVDLDESRCDPDSPFITLGPALSYPLGSWGQLFGTEMLSLRLFMVLFSLVALWTYFQLVRLRVADHKAFWALVLVVGNVQLLTYGAEVLGEVPMLGWLFLGLAFWLRHLESEQLRFALGAGVALGMALLTKAYLAAPLVLTLGGWSLILLLRGAFRQMFATLLLGAVAGGLLLGWQAAESGSLLAVGDWLGQRSSYRSEFLAFDGGETLRFLLFKPVIVLGTVALVVKVRIKREPADLLLLIWHGSHLLFFLASAGYDRFGFQLLFVPAIYLGEFAAAGWKRVGGFRRGRRVAQAGFLLLVLLLASQQSLYLLGRRTLGPPPNAEEKAVVAEVLRRDVARVFTYDQQIVPFLPEAVRFRLPVVVPSNAAKCPDLNLRNGEWLIAGPYARTEYPSCVAWETLEKMGEFGDGTYTLHRARGTRP